MQPHDNGRHHSGAGAHAWQPPGAAGPSVPMLQRLRLGDVLTIAGAAFVFSFSFAPFVRYPSRAVAEVSRASGVPFDGWYSAWSPQMFMAPLTWTAMFAALAVVTLAFVRMVTGRDPEILRFRASQLQVGLALLATVVLLGYALSRKQSAFGIEHLLTTTSDIDRNDAVRPVFAWGGYLMVVGSVVCSAGAILNHFNVGPTVSAAFAPAAPQTYQPGAYSPPTQYSRHNQYGPASPSNTSQGRHGPE